MKVDVKTYLKDYLKKEKITLTQVISMVNENRTDSEKTSLQNISNKLNKGTIKYSEIIEIANVLDCDVVFKKRNDYSEESINKTSLLKTKIHNFTDLILNIITIVANDINDDFDLKKDFKSFLNEKDDLSLQIIYLKYYNLFYRLMLMSKEGNEFIPAVTYIRNIYLQGGLNTLILSDQKNLIELLSYFDNKYNSIPIEK